MKKDSPISSLDLSRAIEKSMTDIEARKDRKDKNGKKLKTNSMGRTKLEQKKEELKVLDEVQETEEVVK